MKLINFSLLLLTLCAAQGKASSVGELPCMNMTHSSEVIACMISLAESTKEKYNKEYHLYMSSIMAPEERSYDKKNIYLLAKEAKKNWDIYTEKECLAEASVYEKDSDGFNDTYNSCLIEHYNARITYYKNNKF